jgi:para-aminobenzoate synthetase / 4-amino-4-deoxychorismate lyase
MFESPVVDARDPGLGVFETLLVHAGGAVEVERHLARLGRSLEALYGAPLPPSATVEANRKAAGLDLGRMRLTATPVADEVEVRATVEAIDPALVCPAAGASLRARQVRGGLGPDKLVHRPLGNRGSNGPGALVVEGNSALEAAWANLFAVRHRVLVTPPADGRILPGIARAAVIEIARDEGIEIAERTLPLDALASSEEVFLTNSVRGIEPATALDGIPLAGSGPVSRRLAAALRRRWGLPAAAAAPPALAAAQSPGPPAR